MGCREPWVHNIQEGDSPQSVGCFRKVPGRGRVGLGVKALRKEDPCLEVRAARGRAERDRPSRPQPWICASRRLYRKTPRIPACPTPTVPTLVQAPSPAGGQCRGLLMGPSLPARPSDATGTPVKCQMLSLSCSGPSTTPRPPRFLLRGHRPAPSHSPDLTPTPPQTLHCCSLRPLAVQTNRPPPSAADAPPGASWLPYLLQGPAQVPPAQRGRPDSPTGAAAGCHLPAHRAFTER